MKEDNKNLGDEYFTYGCGNIIDIKIKKIFWRDIPQHINIR
jgi:hypothetical protein